ncbi:beta-lactamase [Clostridium acetobutylicum]|nr:beta-lactamase [Clostridium acetobutylicum]
MKFTWYGQSCFLIETKRKKKILLDPFNNSIGYPTFKGEADIITVSHHHFDHDFIDCVTNSPKVIDKPGDYKIDDITIKGIPSFHDNVHGAARGENTIFLFNIDGFNVCHLGDIGYVLSDLEVKNLGNVDVLMIPVGGNFTIDGEEAGQLCKKINSNIILPMHYKTTFTILPLEGAEKFIMSMKNAERLQSNVLTLDTKTNEKNQVKIFSIK